ncbi:MAG: hypothetical protein ACTHLJ_14955 [Angustibacter sp.]
MRWENLFADLEGELEAAEAAERQGEVAERTRVELAQVPWADRLAAAREVSLDLLGGTCVRGAVATVGDGWAVVATSGQPRAPVVVRLAAVVSAQGLGRPAHAPGRAQVERRLALAAAVRRIARDRSPVTFALVDGRRLVGTIDAVGADHVDLAEHPAGESRRSAGVSRALTVPLGALASITPVGETSWA